MSKLLWQQLLVDANSCRWIFRRADCSLPTSKHKTEMQTDRQTDGVVWCNRTVRAGSYPLKLGGYERRRSQVWTLRAAQATSRQVNNVHFKGFSASASARILARYGDHRIYDNRTFDGF